MVHELTIICNKIYIFQNMNTAFAKCQKTKRIHLQKKSTFNQKIFKVLLAKKKRKHSVFFDGENADPSKKNNFVTM